MPKVHINGAELYYEDVGSGPETVFLSHGLLFSTRMFDKQVEAFKGRYRCVSYDHRGQGQSELTKDGYDMETLTQDALGLMDHLKLGPVHFVGLSMGGFVGMRIAARWPERLKTLTLMETSAGPEPQENVPKYRTLSFVARLMGFRPVATRVMNIMFSQDFMKDPAREAERKHWKEFLLQRNTTGVSRALEGVITRKPVLDELGKIRTPTLVMVGDQDVATVPAKAEQIHQGIAGSKRVIIPKAGHSSTVEQPAFVNAQLEKFWGEAGKIQAA